MVGQLKRLKAKGRKCGKATAKPSYEKVFGLSVDCQLPVRFGECNKKTNSKASQNIYQDGSPWESFPKACSYNS